MLGAAYDLRVPQSPVYRISSVRRSLADDQRTRVRRYLISMAVRTGCFIGAVFVDGPLRWVLLVGSVFLPWVAVVLANGSRENSQAGAQYLSEPRELD